VSILLAKGGLTWAFTLYLALDRQRKPTMNPLSTQRESPHLATGPAVIPEADLLDDVGVARGLLEGAPDAVVIVNSGGVIQLVNRQAETMFGYRRAELVGRPVDLLLPETSARDHPLHRLQYAAQTTPRAAGLRARRRDGEDFPADLMLAQLTTEDGRSLVTAMFRDISERLRIERHLQALLDSAPDAMVVTAPDGTVRQVNSQAETMFGYPRQELDGQPFSLLVPEAESIRGPAHAVGPGLRLPARRRDGSHFPAEITLSSLEDAEGGLQVTAAIRDVSDQVALEQQLRTARDAADAANAAKSDFLSRMSHELRTPLNAVIGFAQILELDELTEDQQDAVAQIAHGGRHLLELINEVLDIARIESGRLSLSCEPVYLAEVLEEVTDLVRPLASARRITVAHRSLSGVGIYVLGDRQRLKQVLLNVLSNAIKYNRAGGRVELEWVTDVQEDEVGIVVRDTGAGIAEDQMPKLFDPFERLGAEHTEVEGSGVGLAISLKLVQAMGGRIEVASALGQGTTFTVVVPHALPAPGSELPPAPSAPDDITIPVPGQDGGLMVLYVEDNLPNLRLMERIVARRPHWQLVHALHGSLGVELARSQRPDLVLLDLHLPDIPGSLVLERLREDPATRSVPVYIVTADATRGQRERLTEVGAEGFLTKPIVIADVLSALDDVEAVVVAARASPR
jgi:protein-histidine pros-kinase